MATVFSRTFIMYILLLLSMRLMGKRQVGELEISELSITFMLSELAVLPISDKHIPLLQTVIPILVLLSLEVILSFFISKSATFKKLLIGKPSIIIERGKLNQKALERLRMSLSELMSEMRLKGVSSVSEVEYAIIEDNGQLSVFKKAEFSPYTAGDAAIDHAEPGIGHCIIIQGKLFKDNLTVSGKDEAWVHKQLKKRGLDMENVYLMSVNDADDIYIILKGN